MKFVIKVSRASQGLDSTILSAKTSEQFQRMVFERVSLFKMDTTFKVFVFDDTVSDADILIHSGKGGQCWGIAKNIPTRSVLKFEVQANGYLGLKAAKRIVSEKGTMSNQWAKENPYLIFNK